MRARVIKFARHLASINRLRDLCVVLVFLLLGDIGVLTQAEHAAALKIRALYSSEWGVPYPSGLAYAHARDHLLLLNTNTAESTSSAATVVVITPYEELVGSAAFTAAVDDAINVAYDDANDHLLLLNSEQAKLSQIAVGADGIPDAASLIQSDVAHLGLQKAAGMSVDPIGRRLFVLDGGASTIVSVDLDNGLSLTSKMDLSFLDASDLRGIAVHPISHNLFIVSQIKKRMYELTPMGDLVDIYDLADLALVDARGLAFAPSADLTDDPDTIHLYMADSNLPDVGEDATAQHSLFNQLYLPLVNQSIEKVLFGGRAGVAPAAMAQMFGRILEIALPPPDGGGTAQVVTVQVTSGADDSEEIVDTGATHLASSDLELIRDGERDQIVGIRFSSAPIPANAAIVNAYIEFEADERGGSPTTLIFHGQAADDAPPFAKPNSDISSRALTTATVTWPDVPPWAVVHEKHQTPNLAPIVQEIVGRSGWDSGNALAFIISGTGVRTAESYEGDPAGAPKLVVEYAVQNPAARFAVIGDYGRNNSSEAQVAALVDGWNPDFVVTTGDNNYPDGAAATIDDNIGQYYSQFIGNYHGAYGPGSATNRFWPSLGNHDWHTISCIERDCKGAYFDYFTLPNNERYYDVDQGLVHLFMLDSDSDEPDGRNQSSRQAEWLQSKLAASRSCYNLVFLHHAPYSSGRHGSTTAMQWPFAAWGADAVFSGHDHLYERLDVGGAPYFVDGAGGAGLYTFDHVDNVPSEAESRVRYKDEHGAMLVTATTAGITYRFYNVDGVLIDEYPVRKECANFPTPNPTPTPTLTPTLAPTSPPTKTLVPTAPSTATPEPTPAGVAYGPDASSVGFTIRDGTLG